MIKKFIEKKSIDMARHHLVMDTDISEKEEKNNTKNEENMTNEEINRAEALVDEMLPPQQVKRIKKEKGLIERTESSKIILSEDNRQILND